MKLFTNEIVFRGHPDKVCDQIAGAILNYALSLDKESRVAVECAIKNEELWIFGEVTTTATMDYKSIARRVLNDIGYKQNYNIRVNITKQSLDISQGVDNDGAGDNGVMFGYACNDNKECLPEAQVILQKFAKRYDELVQMSPNEFYPDGKAEITARYDDENKIIDILTFTICYCNPENNRETSDRYLIDYIFSVCGEKVPYKILINPTGKFNIGGSFADSGLTGRKIVVDAYEGFAPVGGGSMNGKDPSKVDLTGAYKAREMAVDYLNKFNLQWCEVQLAYAIGKAEPLSILVKSNIGIVESFEEDAVIACEPKRMIEDLNMKNIDYEQKAKFGHFTSEIL